MYRLVFCLVIVSRYTDVLKKDCTLGHKEAYPALLEAILGAEETLSPQLQTCWTLEGTRLIWTVNAYTRPRRRDYLCHGVQEGIMSSKIWAPFREAVEDNQVRGLPQDVEM